jgi:DNA-binding XRE family transcriptional regulator
MENRKIYNRIMILRKEKGLSRVELAEMIGVNFQTIGYLEREEYNPSLDLAFRIAEVFDCIFDGALSVHWRPAKRESKGDMIWLTEASQ